MKFLDKFPQYGTNDFYIMGESYAGIYIPTLMKTLSHYPIFSGILKGAAIGNGMLEYRMNFNTMIFFANKCCHLLFSMIVVKLIKSLQKLLKHLLNTF